MQVLTSYVKSNNEVVYNRYDGSDWVPDDRSNHFIYEENINALYVSVNKKWNNGVHKLACDWKILLQKDNRY